MLRPRKGLLPPFLTLLLPTLAGVFCTPLQAQTFADAGVELLHNDNLGRSITSSFSDTGVTGWLSGGYHWQPGIFTSLTLTGALRKSKWEQFAGLDNQSLSAGGELAHKFGIGETRPVLKAGLQVERLSFRKDFRDATVTTAYIGIGKRVSDRLSLDVRLAHEDSDSQNNTALPVVTEPGRPALPPKTGKVWDYSVDVLRISSELDLGPSSWLATSFQYRDGPVVATAAVYTTPNTAALASTYDPAFGPHAVSYQLGARSRVLSIDYNRAVFERATWYAGVEFQHSTASSGVNYEVRLLRVGFIHGF